MNSHVLLSLGCKIYFHFNTGSIYDSFAGTVLPNTPLIEHKTSFKDLGPVDYASNEFDVQGR